MAINPGDGARVVLNETEVRSATFQALVLLLRKHGAEGGKVLTFPMREMDSAQGAGIHVTADMNEANVTFRLIENRNRPQGDGDERN